MSTIHYDQNTTSTPEQFIDVVNVREGRNLKGRVLAFVLGTVGERVLVSEFAKTIKAIEARNYERDSAGSETPAMSMAC
jgi:hypothetical protein